MHLQRWRSADFDGLLCGRWGPLWCTPSLGAGCLSNGAVRTSIAFGVGAGIPEVTPGAAPPNVSWQRRPVLFVDLAFSAFRDWRHYSAATATAASSASRRRATSQ